MLDNLITALREEVAIDGPSGTSICVFWGYAQKILTEIVEKGEAKGITPIVDEKYKQFIWSHIKLDPELEFYENVDLATTDSENANIAVESFSEANSKKPQGKKRKALEESDEECEEENAESTKKSSSKKEDDLSFETTNLKMIENARNMEYNDVKKYGMSFCVVATAKLQEEQLYIGLPTNVSLSQNLLIILKHILRSRYKGVYQSDVSKVFSIDARSAGHYCKSMSEKGCIVRNGISISSTRTNLCLHARFATTKKDVDMSRALEENFAFYNVNVNNQSFNQIQLRDAMIDLLRDAPGQRILAQDVLQALGFSENRPVKAWFNRTLNELCLKGYFKKTNLKIDNKGKTHRCIHLLKSPRDKEKEMFLSDSLEEITLPFRIKSTKGDEVPILHCLHDLAFYTQLYQVIEASGTQGVTSREIMFSLNMDENRLLYRVLDEIMRLNTLNKGYYGIQRHFEFEGRLRRFRYFTEESYLKMKETKLELPELPDMLYDFPSCKEANLFEKAQVQNTTQRKTSAKKKPTKKVPKTKKNVVFDTVSHKADQEGQANTCMTTNQSQPNIAPETTLGKHKVKPRVVEAIGDAQEIASVTRSVPETVVVRKAIEKQLTAIDTPEHKQFKENTQKKKRQSGIIDFFTKQQKKSETSKRDLVNIEKESEKTPELVPIVVIPTSPILKTRVLELPTTKSVSKEKATRQKTFKVKTSKENLNKGSKIKTYSHRNEKLNSYMEQRIQVLEKFLEKEPLIEIDMIFRSRFQKKVDELFNNSSHAIVCLKTIRRTATAFEKRGGISQHSLECTTTNGTVTNRSFIMRGDLTVDSPEYRNYVEFLKTRYMFNTTHTNPETYETISIPVERLTERLDRMKNLLKDTTTKGDALKAASLKQQIDVLNKNYQRCRNEKLRHKPAIWTITAVQYGFNCARMMRVKAIHKYLMSLLMSQEDVPGVDKKNCTITTSCIVTNLPFLIICEVFGITDPGEEIRQYHEKLKGKEVKLSDVPSSIRKRIGMGVRFKSRMKAIFNTLIFLKLLTPYNAGNEPKKERPSMAIAYTLNIDVDLCDETKVDAPVVRSFKLLSDEDIEAFWFELSAIYRRNINLVEDEPIHLPSDANRAREVTSLLSPKNWVNPGIYSKPQRRILNSYVDKKKCLTPLNNERLLHEIALDIDYPVVTVRKYYEKIEQFFSHRETASRIKKFEKSILSRVRRANTRVNMRDGRSVLKVDKKHRFESRKTRRNHLGVSSTGAEDGANSAPFMDDLSSIPKVNDETGSGVQGRKKKTKDVWTEEEDQLLMYSAVILRHRCRGAKYKWGAITKVVDKPLYKCRNRFANFMKYPAYATKIEEYIDKWDTIYKRGILSGSIVDLNPYETVNFDLLDHIYYFIKKLSEKTEFIQDIRLPKNLSGLRDFQIARPASASVHSLEEQYYKAKTMQSRRDIMLQRTYSSRRSKITDFDQPSTFELEKDLNKDERQISKFRCLVLMSLFTPSENFDPIDSWLMIQSFPTDISEKAIDRLTKSGLLIKKPFHDRVLPGTTNALSIKFSSTFSMTLPSEVLSQAREYHSFLNKKDEMITLKGETVSSGMMLCMLDLISQQKLLLDIRNRDQYLKLNNNRQSSRVFNREAVYFDVNHQKVASTVIDGTLVCSKQKLEHVEIESLDSIVNSIAVCMVESDRSLVKEVVEVLKERKSQGIMLHELKEVMKALYTDLSICNILDILKDHKPPLVYVVGYHTIRYVLNPFANEWIMNMDLKKNYETLKPQEIGSNLVNAQLKKTEKERCIMPKLWTDLNGATTNTLFQSFCRSVLDLIMARPGITNSSILRHFGGLMTRKELYDILVELISQGIVNEKKVVVDCYEKPSVFSKTRVFRTPKMPLEIANSVQTCYWSNMGCYKYFE